MQEMQATLQIKAINKSFGKKKIIDNVSFEIMPGEIFGFLGPNGAGKTTVIKMITGLLKIDSGEIFINGYNVRKHHEKALSVVGGIIENPEMYGYLTGMENLKIAARMHNNITKGRFDEIIETVKLKNRINDRVKKYSLGMRQRLGLAQALIHKPRLLVLDEPTNGLDPAGIKELRDTLHYIASEDKVSVLVSSHLLSEMELLCDRFGIIDNGRIIDFINPKEKKAEDTARATVKYSISFECDESNSSNSKKAVYKIFEEFDEEFIGDEKDEKGESNITLTKEMVPELVKKLVAHDVKIYHIMPISSTLEEEFMKITSGTKGQIR